jgi:hypothetical protein
VSKTTFFRKQYKSKKYNQSRCVSVNSTFSNSAISSSSATTRQATIQYILLTKIQILSKSQLEVETNSPQIEKHLKKNHKLVETSL